MENTRDTREAQMDTKRRSEFDHALITRWRGAEWMMHKRMNANARSVVDDCDDVSCTMLVYSRALATQCQTMPNSVSCSSGVSRPDTPPCCSLGHQNIAYRMIADGMSNQDICPPL